MADFSFDGLKLTSDGKKFMAELNKLKGLEICVGFQSGDSRYEDGADTAEIAAFNELGTSDMPARPFMKQSWENHEDDLKKACQAANNMIASGKSAQQAASMLGAVGVGIVQSEIVEGQFAPNAPSTIRKKGSDRPLIDTGHMRQSVKYVVRKGG